MAKEEVVRRRKHNGKGSRGQKDSRRNTKEGELPAKSPRSSDNVHVQPETPDELRKARLAYLEKTPEERRTLSMKYVGETVQKKPSAVLPTKKTTSKKRDRPASESGHRRHRKTRVSEKDSDDSEHVYRQSQTVKSSRKSATTNPPHILPTVVEENDAQEPLTTQKVQRKHAVDQSEKRYSSSNRSESTHSIVDVARGSQRGESDPIWRLSIPRQRSTSPQKRTPRAPRRSSSTRESVTSSRPSSIRRSSTSLVPRQESRARIPPKRSLSTSSVATKSEKKPTGILATFFKGPPQSPQTPEKKVSCLTCSEDVAVSKAAKLACSHRMCHTCLKRVFTMSVTDPAHMPPKCCTSNHIPLKHVDKLFDQKFKVTWNRKFQEYNTRNRIYCPSKGCGEWIKPNHITLDQGRKVGKCKKCGTRVCGLCNNRMHTTKECPKDEATQRFVEVAQREGWQRCYNCKMMVELKEGCNHMTCRCTAEFCMICGNRWKTCDCPWFNYDAVEADRLLHMNIPQARRAFANGEGRAPIRYQEEMDRRREQEQRDEAIARRLEVLGLDEIPRGPEGGMMQNYNQPQPEPIDMGNAAPHFMNQNFRQVAGNVLSGNYQQVVQFAERPQSGAIMGRENPLPPAPYEVRAPLAHLVNPPPPLANAPQPQPQPQPQNPPARQLRYHSDASRAHQHNRRASTQARPSERERERERESERVIASQHRRANGYAAEVDRYRPLSRPPLPLLPEDMDPVLVAQARRASVRRSAAAAAMAGMLPPLAPLPPASSRRPSAMEEMVLTDAVSPAQTDNRIENWRRGVPVGDPGPEGPEPESESASAEESNDSASSKDSFEVEEPGGG